MVADSKFKIVRASVRDRERIINFLRREFFMYEPINTIFGLDKGPSSDSDIRSVKSLEEGKSLIAFNDDGSIAGVCLNGEISKNTAEGNIIYRCTQYSKVLHVVNTVVKRAQIWNHTSSERAFDIRILTVDSEHRGKGLGRILLEHSRDIAKSEHYSLLSITCTGAYSGNLPGQMGMQCICSAPYSDLVAEGLLPVMPPAPHSEIKVFIQNLIA